MESNKGEGERCLEICKEAISGGNYQKALKFAEKADRLYPSSEAKKWISISKQKLSTATSTTPSASDNRRPGSSNRQTEQPTPVERSYTKEQVLLIQEFKRRDMKNYYSILGIERTATENEVKKSYRKLALQFHPDKNPAPGSEEVFKAITKSFTVLSDAEKRRRYDITGRDDDAPPTISNNFYGNQTRHFHTGQQVDPDDLLRHLFGEFVNMNDFGFDGERQRRRARANAGNARSGGNSIGPFLQAMPFLLLIMVSVISNIISLFGVGSSSGSSMYEYSFRKTHKFPVARETFRYNVPYYVSSNYGTFFAENRRRSDVQNKIKEMEIEIEKITLNKLQSECNSGKTGKCDELRNYLQKATDKQ